MTSQDTGWLLKEKYNGEKTESFTSDCKRLEDGTPLAYVIGWVQFLDCRINLDSHPLIPRNETEYWVEKAITEMDKVNDKQLRILDLCSGSGCIGVAVAKSISDSYVDFSEIDKSHLTTISNNLESNSISKNRYRTFQSDLFNNLSGRKYDFILSNPPYIDKTLDRTDKEVKQNEPHLALFGGKDGMDIIEKIIDDAPNYLSPEGQLWIEHEPEQSRAIKDLGDKNSFSVETYKDQYKVERYSILVLQ